MCGRFGLVKLSGVDAIRFGISEWPAAESRYNIAPGSDILAVANAHERRSAGWLRWGLSRPGAASGLVVNVRSEGLFANPLLGDAGRRNRCLIPASNFYEWQASVGAAPKRPFAIAARDGEPLALGAIYLARQRSQETGGRSTCAIATTAPNSLISPIHARMPVIIERQSFAAWLDPATSVAVLRAMMRPYPTELLRAWPISTRVNRATEDDAGLLEEFRNSGPSA